MAFPNLSDIVSTTIENRGADVADNVTKHNAVLDAIRKIGNVKNATISGGSTLMEELSFAENGNAAFYSGYDTLATAAQDVISSATYGLKQAAAPVVISGLEELQNSGKEAMIDLLDARLEVAENTLMNIISASIYGDGTGTSGKAITGLAAAVPVSNATGTYGGIDRATWAFWRNKKRKGAGTDFAGTLDATNIVAQMNLLYLSQVRGTDKPNLMVTGTDLFSIYESTLITQQRFSSTAQAQAGFDTLMFKGVPVVFDTNGVPAGTLYSLNTKYLKFRTHKDRNFSKLDNRIAYAQDAKVEIMVWAGNLTCSNAGLQGVLSN
jgi:hypothetical protein